MKPIIFSTPMVQAIFAGNKSQTRRVIKFKEEPKHNDLELYAPMGGLIRGAISNTTARVYYAHVPYQKGDILWVRETWTAIRNIETGHTDYFYAAEERDYDTVSSTYLCDDDGFDTGKPFPWHSSRYMKKDLARLFLRVTDANIARVQAITALEARKEGVGDSFLGDCAYDNKYKDIPWNQQDGLGVHQFARLWDSINAKRGYAWDTNPWVWVISFERISKEEAYATEN